MQSVKHEFRLGDSDSLLELWFGALLEWLVLSGNAVSLAALDFYW